MSEERLTKVKKLFEGDVTLKKRELWLIVGCVLFAGIVYGLLKAPYTHGIKIGSDNVNNNGNGTNAITDEDAEEVNDKKKKCCKKQDDIVLVKKD